MSKAEVVRHLPFVLGYGTAWSDRVPGQPGIRCGQPGDRLALNRLSQ